MANDVDFRTRAIQTAYELVASHGADGLTMRVLAREVGVSTTALYQHFASKLDVLHEVRTLGSQDIVEQLQKAFASGDACEAMLAANRAYLSFARDKPQIFTLVFGTMLHHWDEKTVAPHPAGQRLAGFAVEMQAKFGHLYGSDFIGFFARWWCFVHGLASLMVGGHLRPTHPIIPVDDLDAFCEGVSKAYAHRVCKKADGVEAC